MKHVFVNIKKYKITKILIKIFCLFLYRKIGARKTITVPFKFTPKFTGKQIISAKFTSKQLQDVDGYLQFMV